MLSRVILSAVVASNGVLAAKNATDHRLYDYDVFQYIDPLIGSANGGIIPDIQSQNQPN